MSKAAVADAHRELARDFTAGRITAEQYERIGAQLDQGARPAAPERPAPAVQLQAPRLPFPRRTINRQDPTKRRRWAARGYVPPGIAEGLTMGETAVLAVVGSLCILHGACTLSHARLAELAGVSVTMARNALRHARRLGLISCEERRQSAYRHRPNVVRVISREWSAWLRFRGRQGVKSETPDNTGLEKEGLSRGEVASSGPPGLDSQAPRDPRSCESRSRPPKTRSA